MVDPVEEAKQFYEHIARLERREEDFHSLLSERVRFFEDYPFGVQEGSRILDCACGGGQLALPLARLGYRVVGSDVCPAMVRLARRRAKMLEEQVRFHESAWRDLPSRVRGRFDLVLCLGNSLPHARTDAELLSSLEGMRAVLRTGGLCRIGWTSPNVYGSEGNVKILPPSPEVERSGRWPGIAFEIWDVRRHDVIQTLFWFTRRRWKWAMKSARCRIRRLWPATMRKLMKRAGFANIVVEDSAQGHVIVGERRS
jgi:SAM-dependent methyltransferase